MDLGNSKSAYKNNIMLFLYNLVQRLFFSIFAALYCRHIKGVLLKSDKNLPGIKARYKDKDFPQNFLVDTILILDIF